MTDILGRYFDFGDPNLDQRTLYQFKDFTILVNLHNTDIPLADGHGALTVGVGSPYTYINQWKATMFKVKVR